MEGLVGATEDEHEVEDRTIFFAIIVFVNLILSLARPENQWTFVHIFLAFKTRQSWSKSFRYDIAI